MKPYLQRKPLVDRADAWRTQCVRNRESNSLCALALSLKYACSKDPIIQHRSEYYWRIGVQQVKE